MISKIENMPHMDKNQKTGVQNVFQLARDTKDNEETVYKYIKQSEKDKRKEETTV